MSSFTIITLSPFSAGLELLTDGREVDYGLVSAGDPARQRGKRALACEGDVHLSIVVGRGCGLRKASNPFSHKINPRTKNLSINPREMSALSIHPRTISDFRINLRTKSDLNINPREISALSINPRTISTFRINLRKNCPKNNPRVISALSKNQTIMSGSDINHSLQE